MSKRLGEKTYKEIFEQPDALQAVNDSFATIFNTFNKVFEGIDPEEIIFTGCGTSLYLAQTSAAAFSYYNSITAKAVPCSDLIMFPEMYIKEKKVLVVPITRRSDTSEVKMAIQKVRQHPNVTTLSVTCDERSKEYNDYYVLSPAAKEESVVMTKSFTSMLYINILMALSAAGETKLIEKAKRIPDLCRKFMDVFNTTSKAIIEENANLNLYITLGQGPLYGVANECMNKIKEMAIANTEAYYSLEYRHGPMALADNNTLITLLASNDAGDMEVNLMKQMKGYGAKLFIVGDKLSEEMENTADYLIELDSDLNDFELAVLAGISGQLLGYHASIAKGLDPDFPRNLSQAIIL